MNEFWQKVMMALTASPGVVWFVKWLLERAAARDNATKELRAQRSKESAEVEVAERKLLPEMMRLYTDQLKDLRAELRAANESFNLKIQEVNEHWDAKLNATISRKEREAQRMLNHIIILTRAYNTMRNKLFLADTVMHMHDREWVSVATEFPPMEMPEFYDKPEPPKP